MQNLQNELINILQHEDALVVDGQLNKNKIVEMALQVDPQLIKHLIKHDTFKTHFFTDVEGVLVFDKIKFQRFVNNKFFLPDSYTAFKNKIGLTINDGTTDNYITTKNDVVLAWPHKDCVLEGGQTKEDQKRNEIFWNETLAPDEIDRLLDPKVFTNWKKYDQQGEHEVTEINDNDNLIIKGNNLLALASLKKRFKNRVKLIYIDPPYNTGSDSFQYNDNFNHSSWLLFMKNRLTEAYNLLKNDGVLFIQCDYHEDAYLKVLTDEVFGIENFVQSIVVKMSEASGPKMAHATTNIPKLKETLLVYKKRDFKIVNIPKVLKTKWDNEYSKFLNNFNSEEYENLIQLIEKDEIDEKDVVEANNILSKVELTTISKHDSSKKDDVEWLRNNAWRIVADKQNTSLDSMLSTIKNIPKQDIAAIKTKRGKLVLYRTDKNFGEDSRVEIVFASRNLSSNPCDIWLDISTAGGFSEEGGVSFPRGKKPETLIARIIEMNTAPRDIVLDYHLGSGTTCAVAHKLNRRYIGVEQLDYGKNDALVRLKNVIGRIETKQGELMPSCIFDKTGISKSVNWQGGGSFIYCELAKYNQTYADQILEADSKEKLIEVWQLMKEKAFLSYQFDKQSFDERIEAFKTLSLDDQKKFLLEVLDKNQLYVNYSEIADETFGISKEDKRLNDMFYGKI